MLIDIGKARVDGLTRRGNTPLDEAHTAGATAVVEYLNTLVRTVEGSRAAVTYLPGCHFPRACSPVILLGHMPLACKVIKGWITAGWGLSTASSRTAVYHMGFSYYASRLDTIRSVLCAMLVPSTGPLL